MIQNNTARVHWLAWGSAAVIFLVGLGVYWPTLSYNFFWEDPFDIGQVEPYSYLEVLSVANSNSYYRPLALVILKALKLGGETYQAWPFHVFVVGGHLVSGVILFGLARHLFGGASSRPGRFPKPARSNWHALAAGLIYVLYPLPFEATARASSMHEWLTATMFASFWLYAWGRITKRRWPLFVALVAMALAQTLHENGVLFPGLVLLLEIWLLWQRRVERFSPLALMYFLPALLFSGVWLSIPKGGEAPQVGLHLREALYLSQGLSFPFAGPISWIGGLGLTPAWQAGLALLLALGTLLLAHGRTHAPRLALALAWWVGAISLAWLARPIEYLQVSPRVMYFPSFGAALAWAGVIDLGQTWLRSARLQRIVGAAAVGLLLVQSWFALGRSVTLYQQGSNLMDEIIERGAAVGAGGRALFVNAPDRFAYREPLYPLGYWGMLLAPVSQDLDDFIGFTTGVDVETRSLSDFQLLTGPVEASPYEVNTRGVDAYASALLYESVLWADRTFATNYSPNGRMYLTEAGDVAASEPVGETLASYGGTVRLVRIETQIADADAIRLTLTWQALATAQPNDTVFVHLLNADGALVGQADGDSLGGLVAISAWRPGHLIRDERVIVTENELPPGEYTVTVGLYNRVDGSRYPAADSNGAAVPDGEARVTTVVVP